eukprot:884075-Prymnesium_polylepis.3
MSSHFGLTPEGVWVDPNSDESASPALISGSTKNFGHLAADRMTFLPASFRAYVLSRFERQKLKPMHSFSLRARDAESQAVLDQDYSNTQPVWLKNWKRRHRDR